jgi:hypothetical protein
MLFFKVVGDRNDQKRYELLPVHEIHTNSVSYVVKFDENIDLKKKILNFS